MEPTSEVEMEQQLSEAGITVASMPEPKGSLSLRNFDIHHDRDLWVFENWDMAPGPGPEDFVAVYDSRADYLKAIYDFHFGQPIMVAEWIVPLHRHPELTLEGVLHAVSEAINISDETFKRIAEQRWARISGNRVFGNTRWERALQCQFLKLAHSTDTTLVLQLRRDMNEAYIIHTEPRVDN